MYFASKYVELSVCIKKKESVKTVQNYFVGFAICLPNLQYGT